MSVSSVTSESLQLKLRQLLPSQQGFGTDLSASDTIIPIIDLTSAAEGSDVNTMLQTAIAFQDLTTYAVSNTTTTLLSSPGFYRIYGNVTMAMSSVSKSEADLAINDGASTKTIYKFSGFIDSSGDKMSAVYDFVIFLRAGDSLEGTTTNTASKIIGIARPIADTNGTLIQPGGFSPQ